MRRVDQADLFEILHHIADRSGREGHRQKPGEVARSDRLAAREIGVDDEPKNFPRALVEAGKGGASGRPLAARVICWNGHDAKMAAPSQGRKRALPPIWLQLYSESWHLCAMLRDPPRICDGEDSRNNPPGAS